VGNPDAPSQSHSATGGGVDRPAGAPDAPLGGVDRPAEAPDAPLGGETAVDSPPMSPSRPSIPRPAEPTDGAVVAAPAAPGVSAGYHAWSAGLYPHPVASPTGSWPYPPYLPPPRPRRGPAVPILVVAIVIAFVATVGVPTALRVVRAVEDRGFGSLGPVSTAPVSTAPPAGTQPDISPVLNAQSGALIDGNEAGFLGAVDPAATSAVAAYKRMYANLRALHVSTFDQTADASFVDGRADVDIYVYYCLVYLCGDANLAVSFDIVDGKAEIVAYTTPAVSPDDVEPIPWEASTLSVATGTDVIVAADAAEKSQLSRVLPMAERAAVAANKYAHWEQVPTYLVYLADHRDAAKWFGGILENSDGESVSVSSTDIEVMVVLPDAADKRYTGDGGLEMVIQHEMGHVVTLYNDSQDYDYDSLIEGIAEYIAYTGHPIWDDYRLADAREYLREGKWSGQCYLTKEISSSDGLTGSAAYGIGYLTIKYLVGKYGESAMLDFWGSVERDGLTVDESARTTFNVGWKTVNAGCASYIRRTLHA
jgi:hypothetical protein